MNHSSDYWNRVAYQKTFTHPLNTEVLRKYVHKGSNIVDVGCGYGRLVAQLHQHGFTGVQGFDTSVTLIERGKSEGVPNIFFVSTSTNLPVDENAVDCILLFAVLTCIPANQDQMDLMDHLYSKLKPGGCIYISDYYLQSNSVEMERYENYQNDAENFGVFTLPEGITFRHHSQDWIKTLLKKFKIENEQPIEVTTMNGHVAQAFQLFACKK